MSRLTATNLRGVEDFRDVRNILQTIGFRGENLEKEIARLQRILRRHENEQDPRAHAARRTESMLLPFQGAVTEGVGKVAGKSPLLGRLTAAGLMLGGATGMGAAVSGGIRTSFLTMLE